MNGKGIWILLLLVAGAAGALFFLQGDSSPGDEDGTAAESGEGEELANAPAVSNAEAGTRGEIPIPPPADFELDPATSIRGRVVAADGSRLENVAVALFPVQAFSEFGVNTKRVRDEGKPALAGGRFEFEALPGFTQFRVGAVAEGFSPSRCDAVAKGSEVEIVLHRPVTIPGRVVRPGGRPIAEARIELRNAQPFLDGMPQPASSGRDGKFELVAPMAGEYRLKVISAAGDDYESPSFPVEPDMGEIEIVVEGDPGVVIAVVDGAGTPVPDARVSLAPTASRNDPRMSRATRTDENGEAHFYSTAHGSYLLEIRKEGFASLREALLRTTDAEERHEKILVVPGSLEVTVVDVQGLPADHFEVVLTATDPSQRLGVAEPKVMTDADGIARWPELLPGRYAVIGAGGKTWQAEIEAAIMEDGGQQAPGGSGDSKSSASMIEVGPGPVTRMTLLLEEHGRVLVRLTRAGMAAPGVTVMLASEGVRQPGHMKQPDATGVTGDDGSVLMPPVWPGKYTMSVVVGGVLALVDHKVEVRTGMQEEHAELPTGKIRGVLEGGGAALAGATVNLFEGGATRPLQTVQTNAKGEFSLDFVRASTYRMSFVANDFLPYELEAFETDGLSEDDLGVVFLDQGCFVEGTVGGLAASLGGFSVHYIEILDGNGTRLGTQVLQGAMTYRFGPLPAGGYTLQVHENSTLHGALPITLQSGTLVQDYGNG